MVSVRDRVVLASRSAYFKQMFRTRWQGKRRVLLAHPKLDADAFKAVGHYLYNERLQVPPILLDETEAMVKQCKLWDLHGVLPREIKKQNVVRTPHLFTFISSYKYLSFYK